MRRTGEGPEDWRVIWSPAVIHPRLTEETRLSRVRDLPARAPVLDRTGQPLMEERPVVFVGIEPRRLTDPTTVYATLAGRLGVDVAKPRNASGPRSRTRSLT